MFYQCYFCYLLEGIRCEVPKSYQNNCKTLLAGLFRLAIEANLFIFATLALELLSRIHFHTLHDFVREELRMNLFNVYIFIEIGGTGGGCFRYMYSRFLREAAETTSNKVLEKAASMIFKSGKLFSELGQLFKDAETATNLEERIREAKEKFIIIADVEEEAFQYLAENIPKSESIA